MIPELGQVALLIALAVALILGTLPMIGAARGRADWMALARPAARAHALLVGVAFACLVSSFVRNDFSVLYVANNSNSALPLFYRIAGVWGGHEGSLLLWLTMLGLDAGRRAVEPQAAAGLRRPRAGRHGADQRSASSCSC
jgi:cytochrome c-type biogenesis protein CcmF